MLVRVPDLLSADEVRQLRGALADASFEDGRATAGAAAAPVKRNLQAARRANVNVALAAQQQLVHDALLRSDLFRTWAMPLRIVPPTFNRYEPGMYYGDHVDNAVMSGGAGAVRSDLSVTVFLSDPGEYDGGELITHSDHGGAGVKLPAGAALIYPSNTVHRVQPVTRGVRLAAVTWVQSMVRDTERRELLAELAGLAKWARGVAADSREALALGKLRANLVRMWAEL
jgi:PKHD-type hydroxylase